MTASFKKTETNKGTLTFVINQDLRKQGLDRAFNKQKGKITVPGFRKGKITRQMFDRMYGEEALYEDALNEVLQEAYAQAVEKAGIEPVNTPQVSVVSMDKGKDWELTADVIVKPEVKLGEYENLEVSVDVSKKVTEKDVEERLKTAQNNMAELVIKEGVAKNGDTVVIDFVGSVDGEEFDGGKGNNHSLELGSGQFIPGFEEQLVGKKAGDEIEVKVTFPEDYQAEELAGKDAIFVTTIHEVKAKEVPELDDELAKDIDDKVESLSELKEKYQKELEESRETEYTEAVETAAIKAAVDNATIKAIPEEMIHDQVHRSMNEFLSGMQQQGIDPQMYYQITGTTEDDLHKQHEEGAEETVKTTLVIEAIADDKAFKVSKKEITAEIKELSEQYEMPVEQIEKMMPEKMLEHDIRMKKAVDAITSSAKVVQKKAAKK